MMQAPTSLLIIAGDSPESYSPAGERVRYLALASALKFSNVMVLALQRGRTEKKKGRRESRVSLCTINFSRAVPFPFSVFFDPVKMLMFLAHSLILHRRIRPSHVLASIPPFEAGVSAWILAKLERVSLIIDLRDDWESAASTQLRKYLPSSSVKALSAIAKRIYSHAFAVLAVTQTITDTVQQRSSKGRVLLAPNGADTSVFRPSDQDVRKEIREENQLPQDRIIVVYCGSGMNPYYRLDLVLSSVKVWVEKEPNRIYFVFYVYNGIESLKRLQHSLGIPESQLDIRNPLPRDRLARVLSACDVGLVPFDAKPYLLCARSTKLYEYLSSGLFVVSSGPQGGELHVLFSSNGELGMFVLPTAENFTESFSYVSEHHGKLLNEELKNLRYSFIRENYDRKNTMMKAMDILFAEPLKLRR